MTSHNNDDKYGKGSNSLLVLTMTPSFTFALLTTETVRRLNVPGKPLLVATSSGFGLFTTIFRYVSFQAWPKATSTKGSWSRGRGEWHNRQSVSIIIRAQGNGVKNREKLSVCAFSCKNAGYTVLAKEGFKNIKQKIK